MTLIRSTFDWWGELYSSWFADWLHVHFLIRTVLILLVLWLIIYVSAQLFQYVIAPLVILFYYHIIFRAWNYIFVESLHEWIYIRYHSKDKPNFNQLYLRLCDKVKKNRTVLSHNKYSGIIHRGRVRRITLQMMIMCGTAATLWVAAFGLHHEYAAPALAVIDNNITAGADGGGESGNYTYSHAPADDAQHPAGTPGYSPYAPDYPRIPPYPPTAETYAYGLIDPSAFPLGEDTILALNDHGSPGARLRNGPGIAGYTIIEILWDNAHMLFLNSYVPDPDVEGLYWLRVLSPSGTDGYISSQLVEVAG